MTKVQDVMSREVITVKLVTEADLVSKEAYEGARRRPLQIMVDALTGDVRWVQRAKGMTAGEVMTPWPCSIRPADEATFAARSVTVERRVREGGAGRGGFVGLLLGSVAQQCVHHATCPVVVVRSEGRAVSDG